MPNKEEIKETKPLNLHQKILKIADAAGVLQRSKQGFNYKYVPEEEIQAKVTGAMQEYGVLLREEIVPGSKVVIPHTYDKVKWVKVKGSKDELEKQITTINEVLVSADSIYTWTNVDNPEEEIKVPWIIVGQMEDASQAFGAGATYCNRYFLMKSLQLATTEQDPDNFRSKQQEAAEYGDNKENAKAKETLEAARKEVAEIGSKVIATGLKPDEIRAIVAKFNDGEGSPSKISSVGICELVKAEFNKLLEKPKTQKKETKPLENKESK